MARFTSTPYACDKEEYHGKEHVVEQKCAVHGDWEGERGGEKEREKEKETETEREREREEGAKGKIYPSRACPKWPASSN
jgi:hypothetical protein